MQVGEEVLPFSSKFDNFCLNSSENKSRLPELSEVALKKLKQLTVVALAAKTKRIPYTVLQEHLDMANLRELEASLFLNQSFSDSFGRLISAPRKPQSS